MIARSGADVAMDIEALEYCCNNLKEARHRTQVQRVERMIDKLKSEQEKDEGPGNMTARNYYIVPGL